MTKRVASLIAAAALAAFSCKTEPVKIVPEDPVVVIRPGHEHSRYCGHYEFEGKWYYVSEHRHGVGCGHELVEGVWHLQT